MMVEKEEFDILSALPEYCSRSFDPTPQELISRYLKNHILKHPYPESGRIQEETVFGEDINPWDKFCDPYNPYPWETPASASTQSLYLFTKLSDVGITDKSSSIQKNRKAGRGTWHGNNAPVEVKSLGDKGVILGQYKVLSFRSTDGTETKGQWTMYEYSISDEAFPEVRRVKGWQNQVVCWIKRNDTKSNVGGKVTKVKAAPKKPAPLPKKGKVSVPEKPAPKKRKSPSPKVIPNKRTKRTAEVEEKPAVVDKAEFAVNQEPAVVDNGAEEPAGDGEGYFGELVDFDDLGMDMDDLLFDGIEGL